MSGTARATFERRNRGLLPWLRAAAWSCVTFLSLGSLGFYPATVVVLVSLTVGVLALIAPTAGAAAALVAMAIPLAAGNTAVAGVFLVLGVGALVYRRDRGIALLAVALVFAASVVHAEWAAVALAGLLLGSGEGAIVALLACLIVEGAGLVFGSPSFGATATGSIGAHAALIAPGLLASVRDPLSLGWLRNAAVAIDAGALIASGASVHPVAAFGLQPLAWAAGAAVVGSMRPTARDGRRFARSLSAAVAGIGLTAASCAIIVTVTRAAVSAGSLALGLVASLVVAAVAVVIAETVFAPHAVVRAAGPDVDADELLRVISRADEARGADDAVHRTVVITDMKSFSRLTRELGSSEAAKLVRKHRDIVLPVFEKHGGRGAPAGGDGMLAAFESPKDALAAVIDLQRAIDSFNESQPRDREVSVRAGVSSGDVVLDRGGRPFLGDALNVAARIMGLADGGQVFTSSAVLAEAGETAFSAASHGRYALRDIAEPVDVVEVLWHEGQTPRTPHAAQAG